MNEEHIDEFDGINSGAGYGYVWDYNQLAELSENYQHWLSLFNPNEEYYRNEE